MRLTKREQKIMWKCLRDLNPNELKVYQRINKARLEEKLEDIRIMHSKGQDLTGQDSIFVSAALGYIPHGYNIGNYEMKG